MPASRIHPHAPTRSGSERHRRVSLRDLWTSVQVELHGHYSFARLHALRDYCQRSSISRAAIVCLLTPVPCLLLVVIADCVPMSDPSDGIYRNYVFWIRNWIGVAFITLAVLEQFRNCLPQLPLSNKAMGFITVVATTAGVGFQFLCSHFIGFPLPFGLVFGTITWSPAVVICCYILWSDLLRHKPALRMSLLHYLAVFLCQIALTYIYPAYIYIFNSLSSQGQTAFVLVLPVIKIGTKNWMSYFLRESDDLKPEVVIFNIEIFNALYVACSMQNSSSSITTAVIMATDVIQAWLSVWDINLLLNGLKKLVDKMPVDPNNASSTPRTFMDIAVELLKDPAVRSHPQFQSKSFYSTEKLQPTSPTTRDVLKVDREMKVVNLKEPGTVSPPMAVDTAFVSSFQTLTLDERVAFVKSTTQVLFVTEFVLLIEFTEVIMPIIYSMYMVAMSHLPNRQYYPLLVKLSDGRLGSIISNVLTYAALELLSFLAIAFILKNKLKISSLHQLAFVLDTHKSEVQSKLILWTFYIVQSMLFHFGVDFSMKFDWLKYRW